MKYTYAAQKDGLQTIWREQLTRGGQYVSRPIQSLYPIGLWIVTVFHFRIKYIAFRLDEYTWDNMHLI